MELFFQASKIGSSGVLLPFIYKLEKMGGYFEAKCVTSALIMLTVSELPRNKKEEKLTTLCRLSSVGFFTALHLSKNVSITSYAQFVFNLVLSSTLFAISSISSPYYKYISDIAYTLGKIYWFSSYGIKY